MEIVSKNRDIFLNIPVLFIKSPFNLYSDITFEIRIIGQDIVSTYTWI